MHGEDLSRFIIAIVGYVISLFLFLSPGPTILRIWRNQSTEEFHQFPYLATVMKCMLWIFYGLPVVHKNVLMISINSAGLLFGLIFLTIFFYYTTKRNRVIIIYFVIGEIILLAIVTVVTLLCFHSHESRIMFVGVISVVCAIIMYGSPLSVIGQVIESQNPEFMPLGQCVAGFLNAVVWFVYASRKPVDHYIATASGFGAFLGLLQLCVYAYYTFRAKTNGLVESESEGKHVEGILVIITSNSPLRCTG